MKTLYCAACLLLISISTIGVSSLKCYICNSFTDKNCGHGKDVDVKYLQDCMTTSEEYKQQLPALPTNKNKTYSYTLCRKMITVVDFNVNGNVHGERIKRSCGWDDDEPKYNNNCYYRGGLGGRINVCSCQVDDCNSGTTVTVSLLLLVPLFIGVKSLYL